MIRKTLGGDRLGSGNKMKVDLHGYERSTHDMGYLWRSSMAQGTLVPFLCEVATPGDTFDITLDSDVKTHPTLGPLFGSYKVQLDVFQCPIRLYNGLLHNNPLKIGNNMSLVKLPRINLTALPNVGLAEPIQDMDNCQINPSCLLAYLGWRGIGTTTVTNVRQFNATSILGYWDIYKNYYANKQEEIGAVLHTPAEALITTVDFIQGAPWGTAPGGGATIPFNPATGAVPLGPGYQIDIEFIGTQPKPEQIIFLATNGISYNLMEVSIGSWNLVNPTLLRGVFDWGKFAPAGLTIVNWRYVSPSDIGVGKPNVHTFPLSDLDEMRDYLLQNLGTAPVVINSAGIEPYRHLYEQPNGVPNILSSQEGLGLKTYQSDMFNNWLNTEWIDGVGGITERTAIDVTGGSFTMDQLNLSQKVYEMLNRIAVSGGTVDDWQEAVYAHRGFGKSEIPMYMGGLSKELLFQEVVSNAETDSQPLGTLAGKGIMGKKHKGGKVVIKVNEMSYIIGIISLTPRIDYSQGNRYDVNLLTMDDFHKPPLDEIGFQELITEQMAWWSTSFGVSGLWEQDSAGKQPAWMNYMTNVNRTFGNFAIESNEMFMTLNRRYEYEEVAAGTEIDILDLTTYIDPSKYNFIFAQTALDAQNFWVQVAVNMTARRKMSAKIMPNL